MHLTFALIVCDFLSLVRAEAADNRLQWRRNHNRKRASPTGTRLRTIPGVCFGPNITNLELV
jgi:hypothetical protein